MSPEKKVPPGPLAGLVAANVRRIREASRLTYAAMSEGLGQIGRPIPVLGLRRIEKGERRVDLDDLAALAVVLGVPPSLLIFPLGVMPTVEILPGEKVATWAALRWFAGDQPLPPPWREGSEVMTTARDPEVAKVWQTGARAIAMYREHDRMTGIWAAATVDAKSKQRMAEDAVSDAARQKFLAEADEAQRLAGATERQLALHRHSMRRHGFEPEPLRGGLRDLDEDRIVYGDLAEGQIVRTRMLDYQTDERMAGLPPDEGDPS